MPAAAPSKIDLNTAPVRLLTQLPGISKTLAYSIVNHRQRHGLFTSWEELTEVKQFPVDKLEDIKKKSDIDVRRHRLHASTPGQFPSC